MLKNKKLVYGTVAIFLLFVAILIWNNYQIEVSPRDTKPIKPPSFMNKTCGIQECHGLEITCGSNIPEQCTAMYALGDNCRQFARCEIIGGSCQLVKDPKFEECKACIEQCVAQFKDNETRAFECENKCTN